ncbi:MAG TPA: SRPBCC domain-containing protein [Gammaproteobacteria bacterium]|nr:SRPBCC domain-containing protein [Gammaproteobacteria bacterium]
MSTAAKTYTPGDTEREITLTRVYDAPRALVFKAWTDPELIARWWGPKMFTNPVCEVDARPGGKLRIVMRGPDGNDYPMRGVFKEVVVPERLSFTNAAVDAQDQLIIEGFTTVLFADEGKKTRVTVQTRGKAMAPIATQYLQGMEMGWSQQLDKLAELLPELQTPRGK